MQRTRYGRSYTANEVKAAHAVFKMLQRGGDVSTLIRSEPLRKVMVGFSEMAKKAETEPPMPEPITDEERAAQRAKRREERNARLRTWRAEQRAKRFVATLPRADFRPTPYVFTEWEKMTIVGLRDIIPQRGLAKYFGVAESTMGQLQRRWVKEVAQSAQAEDSTACAAE